MKEIINILNWKPRLTSFVSGFLLSLSFAPTFFLPTLLSFAVLAFLIKGADSYKEAFKIGYLFGFGFFLSGLYWISIGVSVYISEFWWAIPVALFILPAFLALYSGFFGLSSFYFSKKHSYILSFTALWIVFEIARSYLFTGFPWNLMGYSIAFSENLIQAASIFGIYGLSFIVVFSSSIFLYLLESSYKQFAIYCLITFAVWGGAIFFGKNAISSNNFLNTEIKLRLVQPSIPQSEKWSMSKFWENFQVHRDLSLTTKASFTPDIIIWPESAVVIQPTYLQVYNSLKAITSTSGAYLITGGITDNLANPNRSRDKLFASIYAISPSGELVFDYHKSHLVPFGEYIPYENILPFKKLTPGLEAYSAGKPGFIVSLNSKKLKIRPLLCYEVIFPYEVRMSNKDADFILNLTNDAYYGSSSGPYQHFYMSRIRAVENGLPLVRVANNGITAIFDHNGIMRTYPTKLNSVESVDAYLPKKPDNETIYSKYGESFIYAIIILFMLIPFMPMKKPE